MRKYHEKSYVSESLSAPGQPGAKIVIFLIRFLIVNASRIPPRPVADQRLEDAGQQLEA